MFASWNDLLGASVVLTSLESSQEGRDSAQNITCCMLLWHFQAAAFHQIICFWSFLLKASLALSA